VGIDLGVGNKAESTEGKGKRSALVFGVVGAEINTRVQVGYATTNSFYQ
jgi:hypothetical protein